MTETGIDAFDPLAIIGVLNRHEVSYVVIGGIAAGVQGVIRGPTRRPTGQNGRARVIPGE